MCSSSVYAWVVDCWPPDAGRPFGQRHGERADIAREPQRVHGAAAREYALELLANALGRQPGDARRRLAHQLARGTSGCRPSMLQRATPRRMRSGSSRNAVTCTARSTPRGEVVAPAERIDPLARAHVPRHRVDGEVAALEVVAHRQLGVGLDAEVGVRVARVAGLARAIGVSRRGGTTSMPSRGPQRGQKRTPTRRPATRSSSALPCSRRS